MGITGKILNWIGNFLHCIQQRVVVEGVCSSWSHVGSGVSQGSVYGPVLFFIYINDLPRCVSCRIRMYADDTKRLSTINCLADVDALQKNINKLMSWSCDWQLCFIASECKVMHIGRKNIERTYKLTSAEGIIDLAKVDNECDLGVNFQSNLQFDNYISIILSKSLVRPILEYCSSVWSTYTYELAREIEQVQCRATKIVQNVRMCPIHIDIVSSVFQHFN